jgi:hypothetical protein
MPVTPEFTDPGQEFYSATSAEGDDILQDWYAGFSLGDEDGFTVESTIDFTANPFDVLQDGKYVLTDLGDGNRFCSLIENASAADPPPRRGSFQPFLAQ